MQIRRACLIAWWRHAGLAAKRPPPPSASPMCPLVFETPRVGWSWQVAELRGHPLYRVTATEVLADTRNGRWKAADHRCVAWPAPPPCSMPGPAWHEPVPIGRHWRLPASVGVAPGLPGCWRFVHYVACTCAGPSCKGEVCLSSPRHGPPQTQQTALPAPRPGSSSCSNRAPIPPAMAARSTWPMAATRR